MNTIKILCLDNGDIQPCKDALDVFCGKILSLSGSTLNVVYDIRQVSDTLTYIKNGTFSYWYVDPKITAQYESDAVGYHAIVYFYKPDLTLHTATEYACMTYPQDGRPVMQVRTDAYPIENDIFHENLHAMCQNLGIKSVHIEDKRFTQDMQGVGSGLFFEEDFQSIMPYMNTVCTAMPIDTYIGVLLKLRDLLLSLLSLFKKSFSYQVFKKEWMGKGIDFDGQFGFQCVDVYRQYCKELGVPQSPPIQGAKDIWNTYLLDYFTRIPHTQGFVPQKGDIVIWGFNPNGHVSIFDNGNAQSFQSVGQNWQEPIDGKGVVKLENHTYHEVLGILRKI